MCFVGNNVGDEFLVVSFVDVDIKPLPQLPGLHVLL
jgi:hypothetical protein